jgi:serine/threonine protein kinase
LAETPLFESLATDPERLRRFEEEARAIAALSHPNVLAIYDIGTDDPPFLVAELLDGETLRARIDRAALPWATILNIAQEFLAGLAAAHARGIVHRDLKPDNIFITREGVVKILDFGLAKASPPVNTSPAGAAPPRQPQRGSSCSSSTATGSHALVVRAPRPRRNVRR